MPASDAACFAPERAGYARASFNQYEPYKTPFDSSRKQNPPLVGRAFQLYN
jgi:hypothetical protein